MSKPTLSIKRKVLGIMGALLFVLVVFVARVFYIQYFEGDELQKRAFEQQTRDRSLTANRGGIYDRNMTGLALTETVYSIGVINAQIKDTELASRVLSEKLGLDYEGTLEKVKKRVALMRIKTKVDKETADEIRNMGIAGIVVDEDIKRVYPYGSLASHLIGFVGSDNQGIIGLEAKYDAHLKGESGKIITETDVAGRELERGRQFRVAPSEGYDLVLSLDTVLQSYAEQTIDKVVAEKGAKRGVIILMDPRNGEILALANKPDFDLNDPFTINNPQLALEWDGMEQKDRQDALNQMWRNFAINDTYEPGSTFKIITSSAGLDEGVTDLYSPFTCYGAVTVGGRVIKCWRHPRAHGAQTFIEGVQNSCNPVFIAIGDRLGADIFHDYLMRFGLNEKTGIDLPGEAVGIMYKPDKIGSVELATMTFGQSLTITPLQLVRSAAAVINGGYLVTPHLGMKLIEQSGGVVQTFAPERGRQVITKETSDNMRYVLETVVSVGTGSRTYIPGYRIGGKTATSQKLPRGSGKYIASFMAFAPADDPQVVALVLVDEPQGAYYGGQVAGPVMKELMENALPYLGIKPEYTAAEINTPGTVPVIVPDVRGAELNAARKLLESAGLGFDLSGDGNTVEDQFPIPGEVVNPGEKVLLLVR